MDAQQWLQRTFNCRLGDAELLRLALSHRSVGSRNNERLEFLGDAVLGHVAGAALYTRFPEADEGQLSRMRVSLVKGAVLADIAQEIGLGEQIRLGMGGRSGGGRHRRSILSDTLEAVLGAILLDRGFEVCRDCILQLLDSRLSCLDPALAVKDPKTRLQERLQGARRPLPHYDVVATRGEDHAQTFTVRCALSDTQEAAIAEGDSRRAAEQRAAEDLLMRLEDG